MVTSEMLRIVCIGGGTGLSSLLRGIKQYTRTRQDGYEIIDMEQLAAIVSVSDDGGSSGRLIDEFGVLPPGDIRNCLVALSNEDEIMSKLFEFRFESDGQLSGHSVGNLLLIALTQLNGGNFSKAIKDAARVLAVQGRILPASLDGTVLCAELIDGTIIKGESKIPERENRKPIQQIFLEPRMNGNHKPLSGQESFECSAYFGAVEAIEFADAVIIGPGSLYTSILPNLVVKQIQEALQHSEALKIYVCNVMSEPGETDSYSVSDHVRAIKAHADFPIDYVLVNHGIAPDEIIRQYIREGLLEQLNRIRAQADEAIGTLEENSEDTLDSLMKLSEQVAQLYRNTSQMVDASQVQVIYDPMRDDLGETKIVEENLICDVAIVDRGIPKRVIRHDPVKLSRALVKLLKSHPKLNEQ